MHNLKARKRVNSDSKSTPKAKRGRPRVSLVLARYPPMKDTGDDDIAVQRNNQLLIKELQKDRPRKEVVCSLARQTYSTRRQIKWRSHCCPSYSRISLPQEALYCMLNADSAMYGYYYLYLYPVGTGDGHGIGEERCYEVCSTSMERETNTCSSGIRGSVKWENSYFICPSTEWFWRLWCMRLFSRTYREMP